MTATELPALLRLDEVGAGRYRVSAASGSPEGRDVVFGGQLLAQVIMASNATVEGAKDVKSIHTIFARAGTYSQAIVFEVDPMHDGRTFASHAVTASQGERLLSRSMVLLHADEPDLIRHDIEMPKGVTGPEESEPGRGLVFPGAELRRVPAGASASADGVRVMWFWTRLPLTSGSAGRESASDRPAMGRRGAAPGETLWPAASQAVLAWATNGFLIELAMRPHADTVRISDAHRSVSTGVIGHTISFHERVDAAEWLLLAHEATYAGRGRVHGRGLVFAEDGRLVATFAQDSMVRAAAGPLDPRRSM